MTEAWRVQQAREDRRAALTAWVLASVHRDTEHKAEPFDFLEVVSWLGHGFQRTPPTPAPPTPEELLERAKMLNEVYGGRTVNGQTP